SPAQRSLAESWIDVDTLPDDAAQMLALVRSETWPSMPGDAPRRPPSGEAPRLDAETRLALEGGHAFDHLLERRVRVHVASRDTLERARQFALADHPGLATVLAYHASSGQIWLESPEMRADGALTAAHRVRLTEA